VAPRTRTVAWTHSARIALDEVLDEIAATSRSGAMRIATETIDAAEGLTTFAERGRVVPELDDPAVRELFILQYRLLYRVHNDRVVILAFVHGARDFDTWRKERMPPLDK